MHPENQREPTLFEELRRLMFSESESLHAAPAQKRSCQVLPCVEDCAVYFSIRPPPVKDLTRIGLQIDSGKKRRPTGKCCGRRKRSCRFGAEIAASYAPFNSHSVKSGQDYSRAQSPKVITIAAAG